MFAFGNFMKTCKHCTRKLNQKIDFWLCGFCDAPERKPSIQVPEEPEDCQ